MLGGPHAVLIATSVSDAAVCPQTAVNYFWTSVNVYYSLSVGMCNVRDGLNFPETLGYVRTYEYYVRYLIQCTYLLNILRHLAS